jgi:chorismate mutase
VANVKHVYEALKNGLDIIWIGARTSVNPFAVQEIADALKGVDIPVFIKNPVNPDLELWIGAVERIFQAGIKKVGVIHRGFSSYEKSPYRNVPQWVIPIELKRRIPEITMLCDPSHITGSRELLLEVSQKAMDLNYDGLIIESHINPAVALSDAKQQVTPTDLEKLLNKLILRKVNTDNPSFLHSLEELRLKIDKIDDDIIEIMAERMKIAETIGTYKKDNNIAILQTARWNDIIKKVEDRGLPKGLSPEFLDKIFKAIHLESINHQLKIMNPENY